MIHNENSRVKIPALVHLTRLGYQYVSLKQYKRSYAIDPDTNIFIDSFKNSINRINGTNLSKPEVVKIIEELKVKLDNDDLGRAFYNYLLHGYNGLKFIEFEDDRSKNSYQVVTELTCANGEEEFRPDITILINGLPLAFIEVKKPNNKDGIIAEHERINKRFEKACFKRFANITQLLVFSNNGEYDDTETVPIQGAFYSSSNYGKLFFNRFREEDTKIFTNVLPIDEGSEAFILKDNNLVTIKGTKEYNTNLDIHSPTNRMLTSLFHKNRLLKILKYAFAYVEKTDDNGIRTIEKHIMRYPQLFATLAIENKISAGVKNGIIWHTQGSGKTALAYFNVRYLKDYYQKHGIITKFYFIVDRLDLLTNATDEFRARGLIVDQVQSKEEFIKNIGSISTSNNTGKDTITVVNIQKFSTESMAKKADYSVNVQRIYFLDEAHRSYNPKGSFLSNLISSDRKAIMIALTGTPLILDGRRSTDVFGEYIHKYYYNRSIADGYTLKLIREGIETTYKAKLRNILDKINMQKGALKKREVLSHSKYVSALVDYIIGDFKKARITFNDSSIGAMIVCDTSEQARSIFKVLKQQAEISSVLVLHDEGDKATRKGYQQDFKKAKSKIDIVVVYNMLLTGFDAPRLKKMYLGRVIKDHNLLQTLTRVNRPYGNFRYGYVVDFADIRAEFDKANKAYFDELQSELGDEFERYKDIFKTQEEIQEDLQTIEETLFLYNTENAEVFSQQISSIDDKSTLIKLRKALDAYKELYNVAKLFGYDELRDKFTLENIKALYNEVVNRINIINLKESLQNKEDMSGILNLALDQIDFHFRKISESELVIADKFREILEKTRKELERNLDTKDPEFISLFEELKRIFKDKNIEELSAGEMNDNIIKLERIRKAAELKNLADQMLCEKYENDVKYMRTHKRLKDAPPPLAPDPVIHKMLTQIKHEVDKMVLRNQRVLDNEPYFIRDITPVIISVCKTNEVKITAQQVEKMQKYISSEYFEERNFVG